MATGILPKVGLLTFSDGREEAHNELLSLNQRFINRVAETLRATGEVELVLGERIIHTAREAVEEARRLVALGVDGTIFNFSIWVFPHLAVMAARNGKGPYLLLSNLNPKYAGLVGMMASAGSLDQLGIPNSRVWGDIRDRKVLARVLSFARAARVVSRLKGQTFGLFGGRSMGMYTGVAELSQWQNLFGIDIEHIDEWEIVRVAESIHEERVMKGLEWLSSRIGRIAYDGSGLTEEKLKLQLRAYLATKQLVKERELDFIGIKCQPELGNSYVTQCLTQAFLNDPYDMEGPKDPVVCACEVDMDGALTMQILHLLTGLPTLFFDFRHYDPAEDIFVFSNCGAQCTWYAARSDCPEDDLRQVTFYPQSRTFYPAGGATVQYMAKAGKATLARLARRNGKYWMAIMPAEFVEYPREKMEETSPEWPQAFAKLKVKPEELISEYGSNHAHAVAGDWVNELLEVCRLLGVEAKVFD